ncbi:MULTISPECIES: hypothetical protein [unclassified Caballeronia]|uniref:hypothetical protein n=1 Tax=unclassified Caballeronia TaxID=2646786 RepID=UPI001F301623|nr:MULTISPECIES: hypothetical protein [unclassified Caballeronia]MCE4547011.1 hypothetical protein [Caballeronia sp. PC1]MCE4572516.1 hypothetical protein [Caballeronia sp. CLC5]
MKRVIDDTLIRLLHFVRCEAPPPDGVITFEISKIYEDVIPLALPGLVFNQTVLVAEERLAAWKEEA